MKNYRIILLSMLFVMPILLGTGCHSFENLWPWGDENEEEANIEIPPAIEDPMLPDSEFKEGPVQERDGAWTRRPELKLPIIYFSYDKYTIGTRERKILDQVAAYMKKNPNLGIIIEGYCDKRGSEEYNRALGERRALAVHDYLITAGVPSGRIQTISYGEERPAVEGEGEEAFRKNRRAELTLANIPN